MRKIDVGILGATGAVGQRFALLLAKHPDFRLNVLAASDRSAGKRFKDATHWLLKEPMPGDLAEIPVVPLSDELDCGLVFSALPTDAARDWESRLATAGYGVFSNAGAHRMDGDVPLLIPEVNPDHLRLLLDQQRARGWQRGFVVTNPNCTAIPMTLALAPLHEQFGVRRVIATSMQSVSGAGYPGVASLDMIDNVIPFIAGNEEIKVTAEPNKLLGRLSSGRIESANIQVSAHCNRVCVSDGHLVTMSVEFDAKPSLEEIRRTWQSWRPLPQQLELPSAPSPVLVVHDDDARPQPRLDRDLGSGMATSIGRLRHCEVLHVRFVVMAHNTIRGAAGASVLNAELMLARGLLQDFYVANART